MSPDAIDKAKDRFFRDCDNFFDEAMDLHDGKGSGQVPTLLWIVLAYFAYEDILTWLRSPVLFYPLVCVTGILCIIYYMGIGPLFM